MAVCRVENVKDARYSELLKITNNNQALALKTYLGEKIGRLDPTMINRIGPYSSFSEEELNWFKENIGDNVFTLHMVEGLARDTNAWGRFINASSLLVDPAAIEGTLFHEAFHVIAQHHLIAEGDKYHNLIRQRKGKVNPTLAANAGIPVGKSFSELTNREAEEVLAEEFKDFMLEELTPNESLIEKFFRQLREFVQSIFNMSGDQQTELYKKIKKGEFNRPGPSISRATYSDFYGREDARQAFNKNVPLDTLPYRPDIVIDAVNELSVVVGNYMFNQGTLQNLLVDGSIDTNIINAIPVIRKVQSLFTERAEDLNISEENIQLALNNVFDQIVIKKFVEKNPKKVTDDHINLFNKISESALFKLSLDNSEPVSLNQEVFDALAADLDDLQLEHLILGSDMLAHWTTKTASFFKSHIGNYNLNVTIVDEDGFVVDIDDAFYRDSNEVGKDSASWNESMETDYKQKIKPALKALLAFTPALSKEGGLEYTANGFVKPRGFSVIYNELVSSIAKVDNYQDMISILEQSSSPEISQIITARLAGKKINPLKIGQPKDAEVKDETSLKKDLSHLNTVFFEHFSGKQIARFRFKMNKGLGNKSYMISANEVVEGIVPEWRNRFFLSGGAKALKEVLDQNVKNKDIRNEAIFRLFLNENEFEEIFENPEYSEDIKWLARKIVNLKDKDLNFFKNADVTSRLRKIARNMYPNLGLNNSFADFDGKRKYSIFLNHYISAIVKRINSISSNTKDSKQRRAALMQDLYHLFDTEEFSKFAFNSTILDAVVNKGATIHIDVLTGVKSPKGKTIANRRSSDVDYLDQMLGAWKDGMLMLPQTGSRAVKYMLRVEGASLTGNNSETFTDTMFKYLQAELLHWGEASAMNTSIDNNNLRVFSFLNLGKNELIELYKTALENIDSPENFRSSITNQRLQSRIENNIVAFLNNSHNRLTDYAAQIGYKDTIPLAFTADSILSMTEGFKIFFGDPANFKSADDMFKRLSAFTSTRRTFRNDTDFLAELDSLYPRKDGAVRNTEMAYATMEAEMHKTDLNFLKSILPENKLGPYQKISKDDAFTYYSFDGFRDTLLQTGEWSDGMEALSEMLYNAFEEGRDPTLEEYANFKDEFTRLTFHSLKTQFTGPNDEGRLVLIKHSGFPIIPIHSWIYNSDGSLTQYGKMYEYMTKNRLDMLVTSEGRKTADPETKLTREDIRNNRKASIATETMSKNYGGIQVDINPKPKENTTVGSQMRKIILSDIFNNPKVSQEVKNMASEYIDIQTEFIQRNFNRLMYEMGVEEDLIPSEKTQKKIINAVLRNADRMKLSDAIKTAIAKWDKIELLPRNVESILMALFRNNVNKEKRKGMYLAQVAPTMFPDKELKFYRKGKKGNILPAQIMIGLPSELENILLSKEVSLQELNTAIQLVIAESERDLTSKETSRLNSILGNLGMSKQTLDGYTKVFGYRIPTQSMSSSDVLQVSEFLPPFFQGVVTYPEIVAKTGSDYDIDKLTIYVKHLEFDQKTNKYVLPSLDSEMTLYDFYKENERAFETPEIRRIIDNVYEEIRQKHYKKMMVKAGYKGQMQRVLNEEGVNYMLSVEAYNELVYMEQVLKRTIREYNSQLAEIVASRENADDTQLSEDFLAEEELRLEIKDKKAELRTVRNSLAAVPEEARETLKNLQKTKKTKLAQIETEIAEMKADLKKTLSAELSQISDLKEKYERVKRNKFGSISSKGLQNRINELMYELAINNERVEDLLRPVDDTLIKDVVAQVRKARPDGGGDVIDLSDIVDPYTNIQKFLTFRTGDGGIGQGATHITSRVLHQITEGLGHKAVKMKDGNSLSEFLGAFMTSMVDLEKDPYAVMLNFHPRSTDALLTAARTGNYAVKELLLLNSQPIVKDLIDAMNRRMSNYKREGNPKIQSNKNLVSNILKQYGISAKEAGLLKIDKATGNLNYEMLPDSLPSEKQLLSDLKVYTKEGMNRSAANVDTQIKALKWFLHFRKEGQELREEMSGSTHDTKGTPKNMAALSQYLEQDYKGHGGFMQAFRDSMVQYKDVIQPLFLMEPLAVRNVLYRKADSINKVAFDGAEASSKMMQKVLKSFVNFVALRALKKSNPDRFQKALNNLVTGDLGMRLEELRSTNGLLEGNYALGKLIPHYSEQRSGISVHRMSADEADLFVQSLDEVAAVDNDFYQNLIYSMYMQAGFDGTESQYMIDLIPTKVKENLHKKIVEEYENLTSPLTGAVLKEFEYGYALTNPFSLESLQKVTEGGFMGDVLGGEKKPLLTYKNKEKARLPRYRFNYTNETSEKDPNFTLVEVYEAENPSSEQVVYKRIAKVAVNTSQVLQRYVPDTNVTKAQTTPQIVKNEGTMGEQQFDRHILKRNKVLRRAGYEFTLRRDKKGNDRIIVTDGQHRLQLNRQELTDLMKEYNVIYERC